MHRSPPIELTLTKLRPPRRPLYCLERASWASRFPRLSRFKAVVFDAPAGFGKTTVLLQYLHHLESHGHAVAWVSLDEEQADSADLLLHVAASLSIAGIAPALGETGFSLRDSVSQRALRTFIHRHLAACSRRCFLFLDDVHCIGSHDSAATLLRLLKWLPANSQMILASRGTPPLALASLKASGTAIEFGAADLAFDAEEAHAILRECLPRPLIDEALTRTEGWPFAVQLLRLRPPQSKSGQRTGLEVADLPKMRDIAAFLSEEVLVAIGGELTNFLAATSVVEVVNAPVAEALTGRADAAELLAEAYARGLFLVALEEPGEWYRFHHLFREFLQSLLARRPEHLQELHRRAAWAFLAAGDARRAARHAHLSGDHTFHAELLQSAGGWRVIWSTGVQVWEGIDAGPATLARFPSVGLVRAYQHVHAGQLEQARKVLETVRSSTRDFTALPTGEPASLEIDARLVELLLCLYEDRPIDLPHLLRLHGLRTAEPMARAAALELLAWSYGIAGDVRRMLMTARQSADQLGILGAHHIQFYALLAIGSAADTLGDYVSALDALQQSEHLARTSFGERSSQLRIARALQAHVQCERGQFDAGAVLARECLEQLVGSDAWADLAFATYHAMTVALVATGRTEEASRLLDEGLVVLSQPRFERVRLLLALTVKQLGLRSGQPASCPAMIKAEQLIEDLLTASAAQWRVALAAASAATRMRLRAGAVDQAREAAAVLLRIAERHDVLDGRIEAGLAEGVLAATEGHMEASAARLANTLDCAQRTGHRRVVHEYAPFLAKAITRDVRRLLSGEHRALLRELGACMADEEAVPGAARAAHHKLSPREIQVLALLKDGLTSKQIAQALNISINTTMDYRKSLYRKINAYSRADAVAFARLHGITSPRFAHVG